MLKSTFLGFAVAVVAIFLPQRAFSETTLRVGTTAMPPSIGNPYRYTNTPHIFPISTIFDGLTRIDKNGAVAPWLALEWKNVDSLTWRLKLRPNVTFSSGAPFNADAVVAVANYFQTPGAMKDLIARELSFIKAARKIDDLTVDLITAVPTPHLPRTLPLMFMVEPTLWMKLGPEAYAQQPIGTGPFALDRPDMAGWKMSANKNSWRSPKVDKLNWIAAPDASARTQALLADQIDIALWMGPDENAVIEAGGGVGVRWRNAAVWAINFQHTKETPLKDQRVRQALNYAVDRKALTEGLLDGATVPATQPGPSMAYGFDASLPPIPYDPAIAKKLLADAGYVGGFKFSVQAVIGSGPADGAMYQMVAQNLAAVGVRMEVRQIPVAELLRAAVEGSWDGDAFGLTYSAEPTIDVLRTMYSHSCLWTKPWYCNEAIMPAIRSAMTEFDETKGLALRHEIMKFYREQYVSLFLYELPRFAGLRKGITGFAEINGFVNFDQIEKRN